MGPLSALLLAVGITVLLVVGVEIVIVESHELRQARKEAREKQG
jgi:hypothetical protein